MANVGADGHLLSSGMATEVALVADDTVEGGSSAGIACAVGSTAGEALLAVFPSEDITAEVMGDGLERCYS